MTVLRLRGLNLLTKDLIIQQKKAWTMSRYVLWFIKL